MTHQANYTVFSHFVVPFTLGSVKNIDLFSSLRKRLWLDIILDSVLSFDIPIFPAAIVI